ncbi:MAG: hypothetical protein HYT06_01850 [Candidatus Levybacteria bacterium]|nr:hypothetical protein [Candidatus Levybacteria bacterium]
MKEFAYLYPIPEYTDFICRPEWAIKRRYKKVLNQAVDIRYRQQGFAINYVIFDGHQVSDAIDLRPTDRIIEAGIDFKTHRSRLPNGEHPYPNPDYVLDQLTGLRILRVAGFHLWDCVEKLAQRAYERGVDTLVDEDLTELLPGAMIRKDFRVDAYPTFNPRELGPALLEFFMDARRDRPWLWQDY